MHLSRWVSVAWPGLPQLWLRGDPVALVLAVAFAVLLNLALVTSLVWTELLDPFQRNVLWAVVGLVWTISAVVSLRWWQSRESPQPDAAEDLFRHSLNQYLQGNWLETERMLRRLLRRNGHDVDARLLLVGVMRRTKRFDEAHRQLDRLVASEGSDKWHTEIDREYELLERAEDSALETSELDNGNSQVDEPRQLSSPQGDIADAA